MNLKLNASITDFPLYTSMETFFMKFKEAGVDGIELVIGAKTFNMDRLFALSEKYQLPITSFHQSAWSGFGIAFDEQVIIQAKERGISTFTFHPLVFTSFDSPTMKKYFSKLASLQQRYGVIVCLENMKNERFYKLLYTPPYETMISHLEKIYTVAQEYDFAITYDISHALFTKPQEVEIFQKMFHKIKNIHVSSFHGNEEHLPLDTGDFKTKEFFSYLQKEQYKGLLTFEINYSLFKRMFAKYAFSEVQRSVDVIRSLAGKSL